MRITLNNKEEFIETDKNSLSVNEILNIKKYSYNRIIVKINNQLIKKEDYEDTKVTIGDNVMIIHLMAGG